MLDLFAGSGGVARAVRRLGFKSKEFDVIHGPEYDLTNPTVVKRIAGSIRKGEVLAVMAAPRVARSQPLEIAQVVSDRASILGAYLGSPTRTRRRSSTEIDVFERF